MEVKKGDIITVKMYTEEFIVEDLATYNGRYYVIARPVKGGRIPIDFRIEEVTSVKSFSSGDKPKCKHEWVDAGFNFSNIVCTHCNMERLAATGEPNEKPIDNSHLDVRLPNWNDESYYTWNGWGPRPQFETRKYESKNGKLRYTLLPTEE